MIIKDIKLFANTRLGAASLLIVAFLMIYNPLTRFPFTLAAVTAVVLVLTLLQDGSLRALNFKKFGLKEAAATVACYVLLELAMDFVFQPLATFLFDEPADYSAFSFIQGDAAAYWKYLSMMWLSAAFGEELLFRAFAFSQLNKVFQGRTYLILVLSAVLFSLPHLYQGESGLLMAFLFGLALGGVYLKFRNLWINIIIHGMVDTVFLTLSYWGFLDFYA